ncbi:hypothetical protein [Endozoicomonas sp. Mp262]|uniref:hypothetical protein n=1 Tax=Endozoicomonas sp. Mp262 TaxID=2919499 RepID=UPI0021D83F27
MHAFQVSLISINRSNNIFIIDFRLKKSIDFKKILQGKLLFVNFRDRYYQFLIDLLLVKRNKKEVSLYIGNQNHSIASIIYNKYKYVSLYIMDDGLVNYGLQSEKEKKISNWLKSIINGILSLFRIYGLNTGHGNNLKIPKNINATFITLLNKYKCKYPNITVVGLREYVDFDEAEKYIHKISSNYSSTKEKLFFLSYEQSLKSGENTAANMDADLIFHPRSHKSTGRLDIPYEFIIKDKEIMAGISSIILVKKIFYNSKKVTVIIKKGEKERLDRLIKLIGDVLYNYA